MPLNSRPQKPKRFLLIASLAESLLNFRGELIAALQKQGFIVHVAAPDFSQAHHVRETLLSRGVRVHEIAMQRTGLNPAKDFLTLCALFRLCRQVRPDAALAYTVKPVVYGLIAARLARVPQRFALITGLGYAFQGKDSGSRGLIRRMVQGLYSLSLSGAKKIFFQNPDDQKLFSELGIVRRAEHSMVVNGSGVDIDRFAPTPLPQAISFLMVARLLGDKGVREFAAAARFVRASHPEVLFNLVGWIDNNPDAVSQDELNGWIDAGDICFHGRLNDVRPAIAKNSVFVLPSYREGTPRSVLEAMAMGRAIITTDAPGCRETVIPGHNGIIVPVQSSEALAAAMLKLVGAPELVAEMGRMSRILAETKYDVHLVNESMIQGMGVND